MLLKTRVVHVAQAHNLGATIQGNSDLNNSLALQNALNFCSASTVKRWPFSAPSFLGLETQRWKATALSCTVTSVDESPINNENAPCSRHLSAVALL